MMYLKWALFAPVSIFFTFLTWFLAPFLALPCFVVLDENGREWLIKPLRWFQTFDAPLDEWTHGGYGVTSSKYKARLMWLLRNPAYGFAQYPLGVENMGMISINGAGVWGGGSSNWQFTRWVDAFNFRGQWFFYKTYFLRVNIGWKAHGGFSRLMLATHISIRKYK